MTAPEDELTAGRSPLAHFDVAEQAGVRTVAVSGEVDASNVAELRSATTKLSNDALGVVIDLDRADYIDSATIRVLYDLRRRLTRRGQILVVVSRPGSNTRRVLELTAFFADDDPQPADAADAAALIRTTLGRDSMRSG